MSLYQGNAQIGGQGRPGDAGKSAYEAAKEGGYTGTEAEFNEAMKLTPSHLSDQVKHITENERTSWNAKASAESVLSVNQQLGTFTRPNLLDNWYFGRPVDQRGGMLQLAGTMLYSDAACTQAMFPSTKTTSIIKVSDIAAHPSDNSTVYVKLADCVRGYTGNGYTVDRWKLLGSAHFVTIEAGSIILRKPVNTADFVYAQYFEGATLEFLRGKTVTISAMDSSGNVYSKTLLIPASGVFDSDNLYIGDNWWMDLIALSSEDFCIRFISTTKTGTARGIQAAKLELGSTQTLAHQENGVWVMNEVPEYGEQLRRCQEYAVKLHGKYWIPTNPDGVGRLNIPLPVTMRTKPAVTFTIEKSAGIDNNIVFDNSLSDEAQIQFYTAGIVNAGWVNVSNIFCSADL